MVVVVGNELDILPCILNVQAQYAGAFGGIGPCTKTQYLHRHSSREAAATATAEVGSATEGLVAAARAWEVTRSARAAATAVA